MSLLRLALSKFSPGEVVMPCLWFILMDHGLSRIVPDRVELLLLDLTPPTANHDLNWRTLYTISGLADR